MPWCALLTAVKNYNKSREKNCRTSSSRPRPNVQDQDFMIQDHIFVLEATRDQSPGLHWKQPFSACYLARFGRFRSNGTSIITGMRWRFFALLRHAFQGHWHWRSTGTDTKPAVHNFIGLLAVIRSNRGPMSYRFRDKRRFRSKVEKFSHPRYLTPLLRVFPLKLFNGVWVQLMSYLTVRKVW